ncbi:hypothetical protein QZH56_05585 [Streptomyces olivoreticuli]|uniref:hypothetical protein n=1 Tax=Streptomyces olivoreticuli TaxID=68246 RepID=UPI002658D6F0|nr:hypothetical protein [Streptomyces olivoreticuli]WKK25092.1 hypothetical protein QZH56_05585 [Streptomyces olivoreticuli]
MDEAWYRLGMLLTFIAGFWEGAAALFFRLFTGKEPSVMIAVDYLPSPWCYIGAVAVMAVTFGVVAVLDAGHKKALARRGAKSQGVA